MSRVFRSRAGLAAVALVAAVAGGAAALGIGKASGWLDGAQTVVVETERVAEGTVADPGAALASARFDPAAIYRKRSPGVVTIYSLFPGHQSGAAGTAAQGSGFVVSRDGYVLTNSHVITNAGDAVSASEVQEAGEVYVEFRDGDRVRASIVGFDLFDDVGLLKVDPADHAVAPLPLGDSSDVVVGEPVAAIGSPFGQESSLAVGVVSATQRSVSAITSAYTVVDAIQIDAPINRGNSGGPLFDGAGEVIGITAQIRSESGNAEGVGFAIPIDAARRSMEQLIAGGQVRYAWVGLSTQTVTASIGRELGLGTLDGAAVQDVVPGSPAAHAGLRGGTRTESLEGLDFSAGGDVVVAIDGQRVRTTEDMIRIVAGNLEPGEDVTFTVVRDGKRLAVPVTLGERPLDPSPAG